MKDLIKGFFGFGSGYIYLAFFGLAGVGWWHYNDVKSDRDAFKEERDAALIQVQEKDAVIASQARSNARRDASEKKSQETQEAVLNAPKTNYCGMSDAIRIVLDGMPDNKDAEQNNNPD